MQKNAIATAALILALAVVPAVAQDIFVPPVTTADPGYLFPNDRYQRDRETPEASRPEPENRTLDIDVEVDAELDAAAVARVEAALQAMVPEYLERVERDGEVSANDWIRVQAFALGQMEAERVKQRLGQN